MQTLICPKCNSYVSPQPVVYLDDEQWKEEYKECVLCGHIFTPKELNKK